MPDVLDRIRSEVSTRLAELRPFVDEHARLDAALQALGDADSRTPVPASPAPAPGRTIETSRCADDSGDRSQAGASRRQPLGGASSR